MVFKCVSVALLVSVCVASQQCRRRSEGNREKQPATYSYDDYHKRPRRPSYDRFDRDRRPSYGISDLVDAIVDEFPTITITLSEEEYCTRKRRPYYLHEEDERSERSRPFREDSKVVNPSKPCREETFIQQGQNRRANNLPPTREKEGQPYWTESIIEEEDYEDEDEDEIPSRNRNFREDVKVINPSKPCREETFTKQNQNRRANNLPPKRQNEERPYWEDPIIEEEDYIDEEEDEMSVRNRPFREDIAVTNPSKPCREEIFAKQIQSRPSTSTPKRPNSTAPFLSEEEFFSHYDRLDDYEIENDNINDYGDYDGDYDEHW